MEREFEIAVIGMSARFPGARRASEFWHNLRDGVESIVTHSRDELLRSRMPAQLVDHPQAVWASSTIEGIDLFDAHFFGYTPAEAQIMDPQQRLFLEGAWEALEDAAYDPLTYGGLIGVFAGCGMNSYLMRLLERARTPADGLQLTIGNDKDYLTTRVSYKLNLTGPSVCVQTACSTSLAAIHLACQSLLAHDCDLALAGGVSIRSPQTLAYVSQEGSILSSDGHCRAFDARATGTVFGNGLGIAVLKRCQEAIDDGDQIYAVIRGSAMNNDGSGKVGYTAPSVDGQATVIRRALAAAGVEASAVSCIEAHGTGTHLGDPIEIAALKQVFGEEHHHPGCAIGSVKSNIGHLDTAAGISGFLKMALALAHEVIPPTLHFEQPNPEMHLDETPFQVVTRATPWKRGAEPRCGGVSSFGIGGTNVHVILEEAPPVVTRPAARAPQLLTLSARSDAALQQARKNLAQHLVEQESANLADVAYSLHVGRAGFTHRYAAVASTSSEACAALEGGVSRVVACDPTLPPTVLFLFPGQGSQHVNMAAGLFGQEPVFQRIAAQCAEAFYPLIGLDVRRLTDPETLHQTRYAQPALFTIEYALARLWMDWGVEPAAMLGHSIGELVAACLAGVFSLEDAIAVVAARALAMQDCPAGAMLAVNLSAEELSNLPAGISLAAANAPGLAVVSGASAAVAELEQVLGRRGLPYRRLHTSHAYHSELMDGALEPFSRALSQVNLSPPRMRFLSCVTGDWIRPEQAISPAYWVSQLRRTVRFDEGLRAAAALPRPVLLEVGPMQALSKIARAHHLDPVASLSEAEHGQPDQVALMRALGELWTRGVPVNWKAFHREEQRRRTPLPTYPFERQRHWYDESRPVLLAAEPDSVPSPEHGSGPYYLPSWRQALPASALPLRATDGPGGWLLFLDAIGLGQALGDTLRRHGDQVVTVKIGERFERIGEQAFRIPPSDRGAYAELFRSLRASSSKLPHTVVHLWGVTAGDDACRSREAMLTAGFDSLLLLAAEAAPLSWSPGLFTITNYAWRLGAAERLEPAKTAICGIMRSLPLEQPGFACRQIDIEPCSGLSVSAPYIEALQQELTRSSPDAVVAFRGGRRFVQTLDAISLEGNDTGSQHALPQHGAYVITGGFGDLGLQVAKWLVHHRKARIALLGRHSQQLPATLGELGADAFAIEADVSSPAEIDAAVDRVQARFGSIDVVLHLAGVPGTGLLQTTSLAAARAVLAPKLDGALNLAGSLRKRGKGTLILFSSTFSIAGGLGQADYSAANAAMDAVAHLENDATLRVLSVNWDGWKGGKWQHGLAALLPEVHSELARQRVENGILIDEAMPALEQLLAAGLTQVVYSKQDFPALLAGSRATAHSLLKRLASAPISSTAAMPPRDQPLLAPRTPTEAIVAALWSEVLGIPHIGVSNDFFALGGHSLFAIQIAGRLRTAFAIELGIREMLECQTVADLAAAIDRKKETFAVDELSDLLDEISNLPETSVREQLRQAGIVQAWS